VYIMIGSLKLDNAWDVQLSPGGHNYHCRAWTEIAQKVEEIQSLSIIGASVDKYEVYSVKDRGYLLTFPNL
jgi:hypothetical protein